MRKNSAVIKKKLCPVAIVAELLSDTWTIRIIYELLQNKVVRFCELERVLSGISTRTLTLKLRRLEEKLLVEKGESGYSLTKTGEKLRPIIKSMESFSP